MSNNNTNLCKECWFEKRNGHALTCPTRNMKYRKKPVIIDAFKWTGDENQTEDPEWINKLMQGGAVRVVGGFMEIETLEGVMKVNPGDYIIRGVKGEVYPCKPDIFEETYELVE